MLDFKFVYASNRHGLGQLIWKDGTEYSGRFENNEMQVKRNKTRPAWAGLKTV